MGLIVVLSMLFLMVKAGTMQMSDNTCSTSCTENSKFAYMSGKTYTYMYESDITTQIVGASDDKASVHLTALVHLEILRKCEVSMKLNDVDFSEYGQDDSKMRRISNDFKIGLERNPTRFSYQDGKIEDICITDVEPIWVLNVKRGIISLIQNNMDDFSTSETVLETDVSGICNTMYSVLESYEDYFSIQKSKDLISCTDRHSFKSIIQGVPYTSKSYIKSLPLMKSDYNCISEIESGLLKSVQCEEINMFRPFSKSDSGAVTVNKQLLTFVRTSSGTQPQGQINVKTSLKFEHAQDTERESKNRHDITSKLAELCENTRSGVNTDTPKLFIELVYIMKLADIDTLSAMNKFLTADTFCKDNSFRTRKFFLDALPFIGTRASIHMITDLITRKAIHEHEADMWISSLSFIKNPTKAMLEEILPLVTEDINSEKVMLSIGTLIHNYCVHNGDCENDDFIKNIISAITVKIATGCRVDNDNIKPTLLVLKGLGNAGFADNIAISMLTNCMTLKTNPLEIRLAAIHALRREPCRSNRMALIALLQDKSDNYETRIAAYKMLMACPSKSVIDAVKFTLTKESGNQVSSYIWTHLCNLMRTSALYKQDIGSILGDEALKREFDLDQKKFARNFETSEFIEKLNIGAKIEADLIWSLESSLPHSGMLNVTFDVFGQSVNLFEIGGRVEGLESCILKYLRSDGYFANTDTGKRLRNILEGGKSFSGHPDDLRGSLYLRMFGNEIFTMDIKEAETYLSGRDIISKIIKDDNFTFTQSMIFMDTKYMVSTSSGFTLSLTLGGTTTVDLFKESSRNVTDNDTLDIGRRIQPSATVYIASMMSVDTFVTRSGIKMVSTLHTSTSLQGKIKKTNKGFFSLQYEIPDTVMKLFGINSSIYIVRTDNELEQIIIGKNRRNLSYCYKQIAVTGLELCAELEYPIHSVTSETPYFPLTGPFGAGVYLYNRDTHVKYMIVAAMTENDKDKKSIRFMFNTPGSGINRDIKLFSVTDTKHDTFNAFISSPWKRIDVGGKYEYFVNKRYAISAEFLIGRKFPFSFNVSYEKETENSLSAVINFEAKHNPDLNAKIEGKFMGQRSNQIYMETNVDIWYGPNFQDDSKHFSIRLEMKKKRAIVNWSASFLTIITFPAIDVDIHLKGEYVCETHNIWSSLELKSGHWKPIKTSFNLTNIIDEEYILIEPEYILIVPVLSIDMCYKFSAEITLERILKTSIKVRVKKDQDNEITSLMIPNKDNITITTDIKPFGQSPARMNFVIKVKKKNVYTYMSLESSHRKYESNLTFILHNDMPQISQLTGYVAVIVPDRTVTFDIFYSFAKKSSNIEDFKSLKFEIVKKSESAKGFFTTNNGVDISSKMSAHFKELSRLAFDASLLQTRGNINTNKFVLKFHPSGTYQLQPIETSVEIIGEAEKLSIYTSFEISQRKYEGYMTLLVHDHLPPLTLFKGYIAVIFPTRTIIYDIYHAESRKSSKLNIVKTYDSAKNVFIANGVDIRSKELIPLKESSGVAFMATFEKTEGKIFLYRFVFKFDPSNTYQLKSIVTWIEINIETGIKLSSEYNIGSDKKYFELTANVRNVVTFNVLYKCPTLGFYSADFEYKGNFKDFKCHLKLTENAKEWHGDFSLRTIGKIQGMFTLNQTIFSNLKPVLVSFEHTWKLTNIISHTDVLIGESKITYTLISSLAAVIWHFDFQFGKKIIDTDFVLNIKKSSVDLSFGITSSLCSHVKGDFNIQGELTDFSSTTTLEITNDAKHLVFKTDAFALEVPTEIVSSMEKLGFNVKHNGDITRLNAMISVSERNKLAETNSEHITDGKIKMNDANSYKMEPLEDRSASTLAKIAPERYTITLSFSSKENINFDGIITSPIEGYESLGAKFKQSGNVRHLKCTGEFVIENERSDFNFELDRYYPRCVATASIKHNRKYSILVDFEKGMNVKLNIVIPEMDHINGTFTHSLNAQASKTFAHLDLSSNVFFDCDIQLEWKTDFNAAFALKTPFPGLEKIILKTNHDGMSSPTMKSSANIQIAEYAVEVSTTIVDTPNSINADFILTTRGELMHWAAGSNHDIRATLMQSGSSSGTVITYEVNVNSLTKINGKINAMRLGPGQLSAEVELRTPFKNMEVNKISYKHSRESNIIHCDINSSIDGKQVTGTIAGSMQPLSMDLDITTPFKDMENIEFNGKVVSEENKYFGTMQAKLNPNDQILIEGKLSTARSIDGAISISTPFKQMKNASIMISDTNLFTQGVSEGVKLTHNGNKNKLVV